QALIRLPKTAVSDFERRQRFQEEGFGGAKPGGLGLGLGRPQIMPAFFEDLMMDARHFEDTKSVGDGPTTEGISLLQHCLLPVGQVAAQDAGVTTRQSV